MEIIIGIAALALLALLLGGAVQTFRRNWLAALLVLIFLTPAWVVWALIEVLLPAPDRRPEDVTLRIHPIDEDEDDATRQCPYCAETIKAAAVYCRYCKRDLT